MLEAIQMLQLYAIYINTYLDHYEKTRIIVIGISLT